MKITFDKELNKAIAYDKKNIIGECRFVELEETWNIIHTEVNELYRGQGIAKRLVEIVLEFAQKNNKKVIADCSYAKKIIDSIYVR